MCKLLITISILSLKTLLKITYHQILCVCVTWDVNHPFVQHIYAICDTHPLVTQKPSQFSDVLSRYHNACVQVVLILLTSPKAQEYGVDSLDMPKRSHKCMYVQEKSQYEQSLVLSKVAGICQGSWNISPLDKGGLFYADIIHRTTMAEKVEKG